MGAEFKHARDTYSPQANPRYSTYSIMSASMRDMCEHACACCVSILDCVFCPISGGHSGRRVLVHARTRKLIERPFGVLSAMRRPSELQVVPVFPSRFVWLCFDHNTQCCRVFHKRETLAKPSHVHCTSAHSNFSLGVQWQRAEMKTRN